MNNVKKFIFSVLALAMLGTPLQVYGTQNEYMSEDVPTEFVADIPEFESDDSLEGLSR